MNSPRFTALHNPNHACRMNADFWQISRSGVSREKRRDKKSAKNCTTINGIGHASVFASHLELQMLTQCQCQQDTLKLSKSNHNLCLSKPLEEAGGSMVGITTQIMNVLRACAGREEGPLKETRASHDTSTS